MADGTGQRPGNSSFLAYMVGQRAKAGQGLQELDKAIGTPMDSANAGVDPQVIPAEQATAPAANNPPLTLDGPEMVETQPPPIRLLDADRYYRDMGRLPTATDLAATQFAQNFKASQGRTPTRAEVMAHLYRRPEMLNQVSQDFEVS